MTTAPADLDALHTRILELPSGPLVPWFLDVDGVLNIEASATSRPDDWPAYRHAVVQTSTEPAVPLVWAPELIDCVNLLVQRGQVQVRWLTSWDLDAPLCAAPAIGLRAGRVIAGSPRSDQDQDQEHGQEHGQEQRRNQSGWWKLAVIEQFAETGDFAIWTDDYLDAYFDDELGDVRPEAITGGRVFALCPDSPRGLTPDHLHSIVDAIAERRRAVPPT